MARTDKHFRLRISEGLHLQVELAARESGRSLNAEIIHLIERGLAPMAEPTYTAAQVAEILAAMEARRSPADQPGDPIPIPMPDAGLVADLNAYLATPAASPAALKPGELNEPKRPFTETFSAVDAIKARFPVAPPAPAGRVAEGKR